MYREDGKPVTVYGRSIRLSLTEEMKRWLFDKAERENITVSSIMRSLIDDDMNKTK